MSGISGGSRSHAASGHEHGPRVSDSVAPDGMDTTLAQAGAGAEYTDALLEGAIGHIADGRQADVDKGIDGVENSPSTKDERLSRHDREGDDAAPGGASHLMFQARSNQHQLPQGPPAHESVQGDGAGGRE